MDASVQQHRKLLYLIIGLLIVSIGSIGFFKRYQHRQNVIAQSAMFQAAYYFEEGQFEPALLGDGEHMGMLDITQKYRWTAAANLAHFYVGVICMHRQAYKEAIWHLDRFRAKDFLLQARAWALLGDAYAEQQMYTKAIKYYLKAAKYKPNADLRLPI